VMRMEYMSFRGGIRISMQKKMTKIKPTDQLPVPDRVYLQIPTLPSNGCRLLVREHDTVAAGQLIGEPLTDTSIPVHATVNGLVEQVIGQCGSAGYVTVVIKAEGSEHVFLPDVDRNPDDMTEDQLKRALRNAGVEGMTGNMYSSRLNFQKDESVEYLIINGAESEPYLTTDYHNLVDNTREVILGALIIGRILHVNNYVIGIQEEYSLASEAVNTFIDSLPNSGQIEVVTLPAKYPQGAVPILIKSITDRDLGRGMTPNDIGCAVIGVDAALAAWEAAAYDKPVIERLVTVNGTRVSKSGNFMIKLGTPVNHILNECGIPKDPDSIIILGGLMTGEMITEYNTPVRCHDTGVLFFDAEHLRREMQQDNCVRCGKCVYCCPVRLYPNQLSYLGEKKDYPGLMRWNLLDCMECGTCVYTCPSNRPTLKMIREAKAAVSKMKSDSEATEKEGGMHS
jgi:Na+-translocating ferredoxin:NAD+ oxidoreductase subunit C